MDAVLNEGFPDGARDITDNLAINGYWKGMHIYMQEGDEIAVSLVTDSLRLLPADDNNEI